MKKNIAIVAGGYSGEYVISIKSAETIASHLNKERYNIYKIIITKEHWKEELSGVEIDKNDFSLLIENKKILFDLVFIGIHGTPGEDGKLQGYFDMLQIPYTSCNAVVSALTFNKVYCNKIAQGTTDVHIANNMHLFKHKNYQASDILSELHLPLFVKPAEGGSSLATTKVKNENDLMPAIELAFQESAQVIVEEFIAGREFSIGVFQKQNEIITLPITEIISTKEFFDYEAKYTSGASQEITPAQIDALLTERISKAAKKLYEKMYCKGIVRFDFIYHAEKDAIFLLEPNTMPGQSEASIVPQQVRAGGMTLADFYQIIIDESLF